MTISPESHNKFKTDQANTKAHWKNLNNSLSNYIKNTSDKQPGLAAIELIEANNHLTQATSTIAPIINRLQARQLELTNTINVIHQGSQEKIKTHSQSSDPIGREVRHILSTQTPEQIERLFDPRKTPPKTKPQNLWASLAASPAAALFLTDKQQRQAEGNTLLAHPMDHQALQEEETNITTEIKSIQTQLAKAQGFIDTNINTLKQKYPTAFKGLSK